MLANYKKVESFLMTRLARLLTLTYTILTIFLMLEMY